MPGTTGTRDPSTLARAAIDRLGDLATLPEVTIRIIDIVGDPESTARDLFDVIKSDVALSARILKVVNSALYALPVKIASVDRAIVLIGPSAVKNISIATSMSQTFVSGGTQDSRLASRIWHHSIATAVAARMLAEQQNASLGEAAFLAGLFADLGLMIELQVFSQELCEIVGTLESDGGDLCTLEREIIGVDHQQLGQALAEHWKFPKSLSTIVGHHHDPLDSPVDQMALTAIVRVADLLASDVSRGLEPAQAISSELLDAASLTEASVESTRTNLADKVRLVEGLFLMQS